MNSTLCLIHPMDPRGQKVGGIETHVRLMLSHAPKDVHVLMVGADGFGDCRLGEIVRVPLGTREIDFLPVLSYPEEQVHEAARSILTSITFRFALGLIRHFFKIRHELKAHCPASIELQRFEFAGIARALGYPVVQIIHGEGTKDDKMDSLIKKFWAIHRASEQMAVRLAASIACVNPNILARWQREMPSVAERAFFMPVSVDTDTFSTTPFDTSDGVMRIAFAGRLDEFKDPPLMFQTLRRLHDRLQGKLEFHYIGTTDPHRYPEFAGAEAFTIRHGFKKSAEVADIMKRCHAGILTSYFEGMPCYLLELTAIGRPFVCVRLPQYELVIEDGKTGFLLPRVDDTKALASDLADRFVQLWEMICSSAVRPQDVHRKALPYSVKNQLSAHFARHHGLARC